MLVAKNIYPKVNRQITTSNEVCSTDNLFSPIFTLSPKFQTCYITGQWGEFTVKIRMLLSASKFLFFDRVSNFYNRILTTHQKLEI